MKMVCHWIVSK